MRPGSRWWLFASMVLVVTGGMRAQRLELAWPTPSRAFLEGRPIDDFVQPTVSGETTSGLFGCVRSGGRQFHEGLDLAPVTRDKRGEATDPIFAVMSGVVRYINRNAGDSSYGRYVVLEHPDVTPPIYTLYAHLSAIAPGLGEGDPVKLGQTIATMGRSAGGYTIPKDRAHLHFEMGVRLTDRFEDWYRWKKFGNPNDHDVWNGMNLVGFDALDFYTRFKSREIDNVADYFAKREAAIVFRVARMGVPDFLRRYPSLQDNAGALVLAPAGWEVSVDCVGLPFRWRALTADELDGQKRDEVRIVSVDEDARALCRCKNLAIKKGSRYAPGRDLQTLAQLLFGLR